MLQTWKQQALNIVISKLHTDVSTALLSLGIPHDNEFLTEDQLFSIDIALKDRKIAIEVDGPFHFSANTNARLGASLHIKMCKISLWSGRRMLYACLGLLPS